MCHALGLHCICNSGSNMCLCLPPQGPPGPTGPQGPIGQPGPSVSIHLVTPARPRPVSCCSASPVLNYVSAGCGRGAGPSWPARPLWAERRRRLERFPWAPRASGAAGNCRVLGAGAEAPMFCWASYTCLLRVGKQLGWQHSEVLAAPRSPDTVSMCILETCKMLISCKERKQRSTSKCTT